MEASASSYPAKTPLMAIIRMITRISTAQSPSIIDSEFMPHGGITRHGKPYCHGAVVLPTADTADPWQTAREVRTRRNLSILPRPGGRYIGHAARGSSPRPAGSRCLPRCPVQPAGPALLLGCALQTGPAI